MPSFKIDKYMFLFTRKRKRLCILTTFVMSILFITYQFIVYYMVSKEPIDTIRENVITGTHIKDKYFYTPSKDGKFTCIKSGEVIDFSKVNDDYCDCADSTDEPGTNACPDGIFFCDTVSENKKYPKMVPSSKVNDGICDCCDGSEEYKNHRIFKNGLGTVNTVLSIISL